MNFGSKFLILTIIFLSGHSYIKGQSTGDGIKFYENKSYQKAEDILTKEYVEKKDLRAAYYLGNIELEKDNDSLAKKYFSEIIRTDAQNALGYTGLGKYYFNYNKRDSVNYFFAKAYEISKKNKDAEPLCEMAEFLISIWEYSVDAKTYIEQAIKIQPNASKPYLLLGDWYLYNKNDGTNAVIQYELGKEKEPGSPEAFIRLGNLYLRTGNLELAKDLYLQGMAKDSMYSASYSAMADLLYRTGKYKEAKIYYEKYLSLSEASVITMSKYAYILFRFKNYADALEIIADVREKNPLTPSLYRLSGYCNYELANYDSCVKELRIFIKQAPPKKVTATDYAYLARALYKLDEDSLALKNFKKALSLDSSEISFYKETGDIYLKDKQYKKAIEAYGMVVLKTENKSASNYYLLAKAYYYDKDFETADSIFALVSGLSPNYSFVYYYRARCNTKNPEDAKMFYEKFISLTDTSDENTHPYFKEACFNLAYYAAVDQDVDKARRYYDMVLTIDPDDKHAKKYLLELNKQLTESKKAQKKAGKK